MEYYQQPPPPPPGYDPRPVAGSEQNTWAMLSHLSTFLGFTAIPFANLLAPLVVWLMQKDTMPLVDDQGKEAINFQLSIMIYLFTCIPLAFVLIGFVLAPIVIVFDVVATIIAAIKAQQGIAYRYPMSIRFV
jgi:uncharacterized Tic20 family protein